MDEGVEEEVDSFADYSSFLLPPHSYPGCTERERPCQSPSRAGHVGFMFRGKRGKWSPKGLEAVLKKLE